jgi:hypothetical protein
MCPSSQRADALNAITLIENVARLATQGLFGFIFSALARTGSSYLTFFCNAVSLTGFRLWRSVIVADLFPGPRCHCHGRAAVLALSATWEYVA